MAIAVSLSTHMMVGNFTVIDELQVVNDENEQECVETPMDEIEYVDPITSDWV